MQTDVLVIGGGPAGLAAAFEAASRGLKVVLADESWSLGGQLRQQTQVLDDLTAPFAGLRGYALGKQLVQRLDDCGDSLKILLQHTAIGAYVDGSIGFSNRENIVRVHAESIIIATGASEGPVVFPGWTLPGVMTVGAAQILLNRERVYPGRRALVVGSSDLALEVAKELHQLNIQVVGVVESGAQLTAQMARIIEEFRACRIPVFLQTKVKHAEGAGKVDKVHLNSAQGKVELEVDFVCLDGGRQPILEPFSVLNCELSYQAELGGWLPDYNIDLETSKPGVLVAGNAAGVTLQAAVVLTGMIAGMSAAERSGKVKIAEIRQAKESLWREVYRLEFAQNPEFWKSRVAHFTQRMKKDIPHDPQRWLGVS